MSRANGNPATLAACRARVEFESRAASNVPENKASPVDIQAARAHWLEQRFHLAPTVAVVVAELAFREVPS
jgi:hypothetical protein